MADGGGELNNASGWGLEGSARQWGILIGLGLVGLLLLAFCGVLPGDDETPASDGGDPTGTSEASGGSGSGSGDGSGSGSSDGDRDDNGGEDGRTTKVGGIELTLLDVLHPYDATEHAALNTANTRIDLEARGASDGGGYFTAFELTLLDDHGEEHGAQSCLDCPGNLDSLELGEGDSGDGSAYFELPVGHEPYELIYRASASGEEGRIDLR